MNIVPCVGIYADLDEELAFFIEEELISLIGRKDLGKGSLLNLTDGGDGVSAGTVHSKETRQKRSQSLKGRIFSEETKKKISEAKKKNHTGGSKKGKVVSQETRDKIRQTLLSKRVAA